MGSKGIMTIQLRAMRPEDVEPCGRTRYEAFKDVAEKHKECESSNP